MMISVAGYEITATVHESPRTLVYRATRAKDQAPVILKVLNREYPTPEDVAGFKREYAITRRLNFDGVIKAYSLEKSGHWLVICLEDCGGEALAKVLTSRKLSLPEFLQAAIRLTAILGKIHQHQIMHRDLNPSNIIWNPATDVLKIIDFGIAVPLSHGHPAAFNPNVLEGTLAYMSPEQTGRMNRELDYRTDFYSLGITLYEMLLGFLPFQSADTMELIHCHLAKTPKAPHEINHTIPPPISEIVLKLLAKTAEERYQSARGLESDLQKCHDQLKFAGRIQFIAIGQDDVSDRFQLPQKLYGRAEPYQVLLQAFERVAQGARELIVISGQVGVGKSALMHELYKPVAGKQGYFATVQFEQSTQEIPYLPVLQALQALLRQILTENEAHIAAWQQKLAPAVGAHGQVLSAFMPELELILGPQPPAPELPPEESQNRLYLALANFLQVLPAPAHPLVIFLDNVQWADPASLKLVQRLLSAPDSAYLLAVGAYHDHEMRAGHPFLLLAEELEQAEMRVTRLSLTPLAAADLNQLLADTFRCDPAETAPLAQLVFEKTYGNPYSVKEFLKALYAEELLTFEPRSGRWQWNPEQIQGMALSDNVVRFMTAKIRKLPEPTQQLLQFAACLGNRFDLHTLAQAQAKTEAAVAAELEAAIQEGLILPADDTYTYVQYLNAAELREFAPHVLYDFVHKRVREAVDALIPEDGRAACHLQIGRHLLHCGLHQGAPEEHLSDLVNHLNAGLALLESDAERLETAKLNLTAGKRAKAAAAYPLALKYFTAGRTLLGANSWQTQRALTFALHKELAEVECLGGNRADSVELLRLTLEHAATDLEKAEIYALGIMAATLNADYHEAIQTGRAALRLLGMPLPADGDARSAWQRELAELKERLRAKPMATLLQEPEMTLPAGKIAIQVLDKLILATSQAQRELYRVIVAKIVNLSLKYGQTPDAAYGYAQYGALLGGMGYAKAGYEFGVFAVKLSERFNHPAQKCKALCALAGELLPWVRPLKHAQSAATEAYQSGVDAGEFQFAALSLAYKVLNWFGEGINLRQLLSNLPKFLTFAQKARNQTAIDVITGYRLLSHNLCGLTADPAAFAADDLTEAQYLASCQAQQNTLALGAYYILQAQVCYLDDAPAEALRWAAQAEPYLPALGGLIVRAAHNFYAALSLAALLPTAAEQDRPRYWEQLRSHQQQMKTWAEHCPENFRAPDLLLQAETARLAEQPFEAMQFYQQAIQAAKDSENLPQKALAHELTAKFYLARGFEDFAKLHLKKAHGNYILWGATRKVDGLAKQYAQMFTTLAQELQKRSASKTTRKSTEIMLPTTEKGLSLLDLHTVMKASQAFSGEIVLAALLQRIMKIVIENAGAQKGWLILERKGTWAIEAEGTIDRAEVQVLQARPVMAAGRDQDAPLPAALLQYVIRTGEPLVLNDAARQGNFTADPYIVKRQTKSVLCTPLLKQGKLTGLLYLENDLAAGAFTPDRLEVLNLLSSQMAIAIENATLYKHLEEALTQQIALSEKQVELTTAYSRFVPGEFLRLMGKKSITDVHLGDHIEKEITVMFSDIRGFTPLSENMTPQENFNFINSYLSQMSPMISQHHGFIDKYIGDAIMALFPTNADDAVQAAIAMLRQLAQYNQGRKRAGYHPIQIGIGLNTGVLMLGTVGDQARMDGTVISDAVNLASRIEGMTKVYGVSFLIGETTYFQLEDAAKYAIRIIDQVQAKGKSEPVTVFEVFDGDPPQVIERKQQTLMLFKQGFKLYHQMKFAAADALFGDVLQVTADAQKEQIAEAEAFFAEVLHVNPHDKVAQMYVQRCHNIQKYGISEEWGGVWAWIESLKKR